MRWGIRAIIGESFAEIFYSNCLSIGIPCATISQSHIDALIKIIEHDSEHLFKIDIDLQSITNGSRSWPLKIELGMKEMLLSGTWDATKTLLIESKKINQPKHSLPYLNDFNSSDIKNACGIVSGMIFKTMKT